MGDRPARVLIAGVATRALARSAAEAGLRVTAVDAFGDVDLRAVADVVALTRESGGFSPDAAAHAARGVPARFVAYTSNFENYPEAVAALAAGRQLLGNPPEVLRAARHPLTLMRMFAARGFQTPPTRASAPPHGGRAGSWLVKPRRSGGGHGTRPWEGHLGVPRHSYLQRRIAGVPGSIIFLADGQRTFPLGLTRQLVGDRRFGAGGFRYCGSLLSSAGLPLFRDEARLRETASALAAAATEEFGLVGLNGIDFIARNGVPWPIELNPRPCASMELVERAGGGSLFELHARACGGELPSGNLPCAVRHQVLGKAVVFARRDLVFRSLPRGLDAADLPHPGESIGRGHPICTVFARHRDPERCIRTLVARARLLYSTGEPRAAA
jgi:predicted ATP-grasp superfamily ATP-dependent carboligase